MIKVYIVTLLDYAWQIFKEPWLQKESLWMILPLIIILIFMHLYFGRYRSEELGWNSAFGNSISLLWILVLLSRFLFDKYTFQELYFGNQFSKLVAVGVLLIWVVIMFTFNFFHTLPKKLAFVISSAGSVYIFAYIVISLIVGNLMLGWDIFFASIILFFFFFLIIQLIKHLVPMSSSAKQDLKMRKEKK